MLRLIPLQEFIAKKGCSPLVTTTLLLQLLLLVYIVTVYSGSATANVAAMAACVAAAN